MLGATLLFCVLLKSLAAFAQNPAPEAFNNGTHDVVLRADFPGGGSQGVVGVVQFYESKGKTKVHVDITGLPKNSGVFSYHIHDNPLGKDGLCESTGGDFNPFNATNVLCDTLPSDAYCALGDLSGKHGMINTTCFETFYFDPYLSLDPNSPSYIGGKSISIHLADKNEQLLACATIEPSRQPEDSLLLNPVTELEEVKKYQDLSGVDLGFDKLNFGSDFGPLTNQKAPRYAKTADDSYESIIEVIGSGSERKGDSGEDFYDSSNSEDNKELEPIINEDFSKRFSSSNSSTIVIPYEGKTFNTSVNTTDDNAELPEENDASVLRNTLISFVLGLGVVILALFT